MGPLAAGILTNRARRAIGAAVVDLVASGHVSVDREDGPTPYRLVLERPIPAWSDGEREAVQESLFGHPPVVGAHFDVDRRDVEKRSRLRSAAGSALWALKHAELVHGATERRALEICSWVLIPLSAIPLAIQPWFVVGYAVPVALTFIVRRRVGWPRTPAGAVFAQQVADFGDALDADPLLRAQWPGWALLWQQGSRRGGSTDAVTPGVIAADAGPSSPLDDFRLDDDGASDLGGHFDFGDSGGADAGASDGGADGGGDGGGD